MRSNTRLVPSCPWQSGITLLEMVAGLSLVMVLAGAMETATTALTRGAGEVGSLLTTYSQIQRARKTFIEKLQMSDTINVDEFEKPLFEVLKVDGGTNNSIFFRKVERYETIPRTE